MNIKKKDRSNAYNAANNDRLSINVPKGRRADVNKYCASIGTTTQRLVNDLLRFELGMSPDEWETRKDNNEE